MITEMGASIDTVLLLLGVSLLGLFCFHSLRTNRLVRELVARARRHEVASCKDELTGLTNRVVFQEILVREIANARRLGGCLGLAILDVDGLKLVNDGIGLDAGDEILRLLGQRLSSFTRDSDTLARLDGDQFALILGNCESPSEILTAVYRLRQIWNPPLLLNGQELSTSCCVGLSVFPEDASDASEILRHADSAVTQAQDRGFNHVRIFDESFDQLAANRLTRSQELRSALREGELELHLQPQASLPSGRLIGAEGLVRWRHPQEGLLTAGLFIPLAEQMGLLPELSTWVLEEICRHCAQWQAAGVPTVPISVNVSVRHFQSGDVPGTVARILEESGLDASYLKLEVTESAALHDVDLMSEQFALLRDQGIGLQLDDFGTGYSSLSYLLRYPLDVLKIDRSFVTGLHEKEHSEAIVRATLALAESLGLEVVAEGVETEDELRCLIGLGCRAAQGYLLGRPVPCDEFETVLIAGRVEIPDCQRPSKRSLSTPRPGAAASPSLSASRP